VLAIHTFSAAAARLAAIPDEALVAFYDHTHFAWQMADEPSSLFSLY
jgi:hypothetical protein